MGEGPIYGMFFRHAVAPESKGFIEMSRIFLEWGVVFAILVISGPHASAEGRNCAAASKEIANFHLAEGAKTVPKAAFMENGETVRRLADYRGKPVLLNFWATWCSPCIKEMPSLDRLQAMMRDDGLEVLALSLDRKGADVVRKFYQKTGLKNLRILIDQRSKVFREFNVSGLPTTVLINAGGEEVGRVIGAAEWDSSNAITLIRECLEIGRHDQKSSAAYSPEIALPFPG